jgi:pimeloyl-ACP methyl ester carboxylesterase
MSAAVQTAWTLTLLVPLVLSVLTTGVISFAYGRAAHDRRARRAACPFEDDDHETRPVAREVFDVLRESLAVWRLIAAALVPTPPSWRDLQSAPGRGPIVVLLPERGFPAASLARLGHRLESDLEASVRLEPRGGGTVDARADRLVECLAALTTTTSGRTLMLVGHGAGGLVARRTAAVLPRARLRVVTVATPHRRTAEPEARDPLVDRVDVVNVYSLHDGFVVPADRAYLPGAFNVALRDEGHFGLVTGPRPYTLLGDSLADLRPQMVQA